VLGPFIGGALLELFWWGSVFLVAVPVMVLLLAVGPLLLPEYRDPHAGRADGPSVALSIGAVLALIYGLKETAQDGPGLAAGVAVLTGLSMGWLFVRRQHALADPLIDVRLFAAPAFSASVATYGLAIFVLFGAFLFLPQYLQLVRGLPPLQAGLWGIPSSLAFIAGAALSPALGRRYRPAYVMAVGLVVAAAGFAFFTRLEASTPLAGYVLASGVFSLGASPVFTMTNDLIIGSAPPERAGAAAGISETSAELGGALGIAVFGSIGVAVYRRLLAAAPLEGVPPDALSAAMDTLGGALATSADLPPSVGTDLLGASREAFLAGVRLCAALSALGSLALAGLVWSRLRGVGPRG
jgi:DHA2 family multidrug resistance protein-like MFS transporter